jgi:PhnB protein
MHLHPYLFFEGRCEEAIEFYKKAVGAKVTMLLRHKDAPEPHNPRLAAGNENKIMHASLLIGDSRVSMSDGLSQGRPNFEGFYLSIDVSSDAEAKRVFDALADGGSVTAPLGKTFFSPQFGMVKDRFGMPWMVIVQ